MSMRIMSKKALAIVLSVAMLFSCMVFSFSASAEETLMWENSFDNGTSSNWKMQYDGTASNHTSFHSDPSAATSGNYATLENGAMKLGFGTNEAAESYVSAFNVMHQDTTHTNAGQYGWVDEYPGSLKAIGNFRPSDGKYKVTFDYTVTSFNQNSVSKVALYVGYGETFWDGNRNLSYITNGGGAYKQILTVDHSDIAAGQQAAEVTLDVATTKTPYIFIFARVEDNTDDDLTNAEIVVDNVKIYSVTADPLVLPATLKYENDFNEGTDTNWKYQYSNPGNGIVINSPNAMAVYDDTAKAMRIDLKQAGRISGFRMHHKSAVDTQYGVFTLTKGYYKVEFDYQLAAITDRAGAALDVCVGVGKKDTWYWETSDKILSNFTGGSSVGIYGVGATLTKSDVGAAMKKATVYLDITSDTNSYRMHIFTKAGNGYGDALDSTVLVDNVKIYEVDKNALSTVTFYYEGSEVGSVSGIAGEALTIPTMAGVPADREYFSDAACTQKIDEPTVFPQGATNIYIKQKENQVVLPLNTVMWKNSFDNGTSSNWLKQYDGTASNHTSFHSDASKVPGNYATIDDGKMKLGFANYAGREYLSGFIMLHEDTTHGDHTRAGYAGNYTGSLNAIGNFMAPLGSYKVSVDYNLANLQTGDGPGSEFDVYVAFSPENYFWDGNKQLSGIANRQKLFTVTAEDLGKGWQHKDVYIENTTGYYMVIFAAQSSNYKNSLTGSEVWLDNIEISPSDYTSVVFYDGTTVVGQSDSAAPGTPFTMPTLTLPTGVPAGYKLLYYSDPTLTTEIELPVVYPNKSQKIYVKLVKEVNDTWGFETEADNTKLSLNVRSENTIFTDHTIAHSGAASARVNSDAANGRSNLYSQMILKNGMGEQVFLERGKNYQVKFWVYQPAAHGNYELNYWLAVSGDDTVFDADYESTHSRKHGTVAEGTFTPTATDAWQEVTVTIKDCTYGGKLRLGIIGDKNVAHPFYIDDITLTEMSSEMNVWSFDYEEKGTELHINTTSGRAITVDDFIKYSGYHSVRVDGVDKLSDYFPQMMIKNDDGDQIQVYEGRNYEVKFRLYKPDTQPSYGINYWLAATTEDVDKEFNRTDTGPDAYRASTYKVAEASDVKIVTGEWVEFVVPINNCARTGKLRLGISGDYNGAHLFYVDDVIVTEVFLEPDSRLDSFERYDAEQELALNTDGSSMKVLGEDRRSGDFGVKVVTNGNDINAAPQMIVNNFRREAIQVEKGKNYRVSFWVVRPADEPAYDLQYWLAAGDATTAFTTTRQNVLVDTQTVTIEKAHMWQKVNAFIKNCPYTGTLRLGITGTTDEAHTFYIDDMYAYEDTAGEPDPNAMNFEMYSVGTNLALNQYLPDNNTYNWNKNSFTITDAESYTGSQSAFVYCNNNMQNNRPHMLVRDGNGEVIRVNKGDDFFVSFMMYVDPSAPYFSFGYWLAATPEEKDDTPFFGQLSDNPEFSVTDYILPGEKFEIMPPDAGTWTEIKIAVMDCPYSGSLRIGLCHGNAQPYESSFYIDDIKVYDPEYVTVKFNSNGSQDTYEDITLMADMLIPLDNYIDPYREGYEFLGWYTSPTFEKESFFEIYSTPVVGKTGDVITLYARWREWSENVASTDRPKEEQKFEQKTEYYTEEVWVETTPENPYPTEGSALKEAAPIVVTPDEVIPEPDGGMPPWLIVVIIVAAVVVVGGGAALAAILLKKSKKA